MGKNLKGKELGEGICQRKDGRYAVRFKGKSGKKYEKYFQELQEAKVWLEDMKYAENHNNVNKFSDLTYGEWFNYWIEDIKKPNIKPSTYRSYKSRYQYNIQSKIENIKLCDIKAVHCQDIINSMIKDNYCKNTIALTKRLLHETFKYAENNELINKNPCKGVILNGGTESKITQPYTVSEQKKFIELFKDSTFGLQYMLVLQTGIRVGELIGLHWDDVDFENSLLHIRRTMTYVPKTREWDITTPKSTSGKRSIPLTQAAIDILKAQKDKQKNNKIVDYEWKDLVFLNSLGKPIDYRNYDSYLNYYSIKNNIRPITMHTLRHTFATRCIEADMKPKTLQKILGHSNISTTMNLYVHVLEEEKEKGMKMFSDYLEKLA